MLLARRYGTDTAKGPHSNIETLYAAMPSLDQIASDGVDDALDRVVITRIIDMINAVSQVRHGRCWPTAPCSLFLSFVASVCKWCGVTDPFVAQARSIRETAIHNEHHWSTSASADRLADEMTSFH